MNHYFDIFYKLLKTHLMIVRNQLLGKIINIYIWAFCTVFVTGYLMQAFGLTSTFGSFQLATVIGTIGLFEIYGNAMKLIMDFEGEKSISYYLTLPTKPSIILLSMASSYIIIGIFLSFIVFPLGKLILYHSLDLTQIHWFKFAVITILSNIFFGLFTLAITAHVGSLEKIENVWVRFIFPLWFMGGFQFSWAALYQVSKPIAYISLLNPIIYVMEGTRAAMFTQQESFPWLACFGALCIFSIGCWYYAYYKMRKLLDFV